MKKDVRALASWEILRLELAMGQQRRWSPEDFHAYLVCHPLLTHLVRRLVWGVFDTSDVLLDTFRVADRRSYASRTDDSFEIPAGARVGVVHRLHLCEADVQTWAAIFQRYAVVQPFQQLARQCFAPSPPDASSKALRCFDERVVETKKILGLQSRGWRRGTPQDGGCIYWFYKPITPKLNASLQIEGIIVGAVDALGTKQQLGIVEFGPGEPLGDEVRSDALRVADIPAVIVSEIMRDVEALGEAPREDL